MSHKKPQKSFVPFTVTNRATNGANADAPAVFTVTAGPNSKRVPAHLGPGPNARLKASASAATEGILHGLVSHTDLLDFASRVEENPLTQELLQKPLLLSAVPADVAQKIRDCINAVVLREKRSTSKLQREVLCLSAMLVCLVHLWEQEDPTCGLATVQTVAKAAMQDLEASQRNVALGIQALVGWGDVDGQYGEAMVWLRNVVKVKLHSTVRELSAIAFMATMPSATRVGGGGLMNGPSGNLVAGQ
ncbi:MAG: hypothetical protein E6Q78_10000 [Rhodoferax sp.]|nr:MAG: hypothetical protein E6Q78_10000 [Rhodoferax sp.]